MGGGTERASDNVLKITVGRVSSREANNKARDGHLRRDLAHNTMEL